MTELPDSPPPVKLLAARPIKIRIAIASLTILVAGALLQPRAQPAVIPASQERAAPLLEEQVQSRESMRPFRGVIDVAQRVRTLTVAVPGPSPRPARVHDDFSDRGSTREAIGFGVFISPTHVLTHADAIDRRSTVQLASYDGQTVDAGVAGYEDSTGLVLLTTRAPHPVSATLASRGAAAGTLAAAVGHWEKRDIIVPVFVTSVDEDGYGIGPAGDTVLPGMPIYNLEGELVAVAAGDGRAVSAPAAAGRLLARASSGDRRASIGVVLQDITDVLARAFGTEGVVVADVIEGGPADNAGVEIGDVLVALGDTPIDATETARHALSTARVGSPVTLQLLRNGRMQGIQATPVSAYEVAALARGSTGELRPGIDAGTLLPADTLEAAGSPPDADVISVNGTPPTSRAQVERDLRRSRIGRVLIRHDGDQFFAVVEARR